MRYEKKMLILSGEGKGVVLIEKSGLGVRFALRTFGLKRVPDRKVGIITQTEVYVRDLPDTADPSLVFYLDGADTETVHFAVFDRELRLYGTNGKRMWEANLMGLLRAHDRAAKQPDPLPARLPPLVEKPKTLPLPNGTGLPQSRDAIYGDDAITSADFYTPFDMSSRMKIVDGFLDTPRVLNGEQAGFIEYTRLGNPSVAAAEKPSYYVEAAGETDKEESEFSAEAEEQAEAEAYDETDSTRIFDVIADVPTADGGAGVSQSSAGQDGVRAYATENKEEQQSERRSEQVIEKYEESLPAMEAAAAVELPWQYEARFLCKMSRREPVTEQTKVESIKERNKVPTLRETEFFERAHGDIDKLFSAAERDGELTSLLPDIEWVRVMFDGHTVSVGRAKDFLCYAVAGLYEKVSPLGEEAQWLPKIRSAPTGRGFWLVFQDIGTGEILRS